MTKAEESKLLEKIADLIEQAGDDSYIGKAFEGCYLIAKENIDNVFMDSWKDRAERRQSEMLKCREMADQYKEELDAAKLKNKTLLGEMESMASRLNEENEIRVKIWNNFREQEDKAEGLEQEVIKLKAKLYDLICK